MKSNLEIVRECLLRAIEIVDNSKRASEIHISVDAEIDTIPTLKYEICEIDTSIKNPESSEFLKGYFSSEESFGRQLNEMGLIKIDDVMKVLKQLRNEDMLTEDCDDYIKQEFGQKIQFFEN